jgi:PAS domain-containing protein
MNHFQNLFYPIYKNSAIRYLILFFIISLYLSANIIYGAVIDYSTSKIFICQGFSKEWIKKLPNKSKTEIPSCDWKFLKLKDLHYQSLRINSFGLKPKKVRTFLSWKTETAEDFTVITHFNYTKEHDSEFPTWGLFLSHIGLNFAIYLNGYLIKNEVFLDKNYQIKKGRSLYSYKQVLPSKLLKDGENILAFRIVGNPANPFTGFFKIDPIKIVHYESINHQIEELVILILIFLFLVIGFFHLLLAIRRPEAKYHLYFGLFSIFMFLFKSTVSAYAEFVIDDSFILRKIEIATAFLLPILFGLFLEDLLSKKISLFTKILSGIYLFSTILVITGPPLFIEDISTLWQISMLAPVSYYLFVLNKAFFKDFFDIKRKAAVNNPKHSLIISLKISLWDKVPGNLVLGVNILGLCVIFDILDSMIFFTGIRLNHWGALTFIIGISQMLSNYYFQMNRKVKSLNWELQEKVKILKRITDRITISERKYRILVNDSKNIIFTLDQDFNFLTMNQAVFDQLKVDPSTYISHHFFDLVFVDKNDKGVSRRIIFNKLNEVKETGIPVSFRVKFITGAISEYRDFILNLEKIKMDDEYEYIGKTTHVLTDVLLDHLENEKKIYKIDNYLILVEEVSQKLISKLGKYMAPSEINLISVTLREIIINAIEHGNLNITFEEKSIGQKAQKFFELIDKRRQNPFFRDKKVTIEYSFNSQRVMYRITDEGDGFDHENFRKKKHENLSDDLEHGRGILMTETVFDVMKYNKKGNQVTLIKYFNPLGSYP